LGTTLVIVLVELIEGDEECLANVTLAPEGNGGGIVIVWVVAERASVLGYPAVVLGYGHGKFKVETDSGEAVLGDDLDTVGYFFAIDVDSHTSFPL
jgi:hypothetical protein